MLLCFQALFICTELLNKMSDFMKNALILIVVDLFNIFFKLLIFRGLLVQLKDFKICIFL